MTTQVVSKVGYAQASLACMGGEGGAIRNGRGSKARLSPTQPPDEPPDGEAHSTGTHAFDQYVARVFAFSLQ